MTDLPKDSCAASFDDASMDEAGGQPRPQIDKCHPAISKRCGQRPARSQRRRIHIIVHPHRQAEFIGYTFSQLQRFHSEIDHVLNPPGITVHEPRNADSR